jgi:DNA-directed RNA polymerase subunit RPC12/RpoP
VHGAGTPGVTAGKLVEMTSGNERLYCRKCGSDRVYRVDRKGFFEEKIYPIFGMYPWRCTVCGDHKMLHKRRKLKLKNKDKDYVE